MSLYRDDSCCDFDHEGLRLPLLFYWLALHKISCIAQMFPFFPPTRVIYELALRHSPSKWVKRTNSA
jgi:hypothetical protein